VGPRVADGGEFLQMSRVAANILTKQSCTAEKEWSSSLGVGRWANSSLPLKHSLLWNGKQDLGLGGLLWTRQ